MSVPPLKPLIRWVIYKNYKIRYTSHGPVQISGVLTTPQGELVFDYDPTGLLITLPDEQIAINEYGWEIDPDQNAENSEERAE